MFRSFATAAIAATALFGVATTAKATIYNVTSAGLYHYGKVDLAGSVNGTPFNRSEFAGAIVLKGTTAGGQAFSVITYCFDILHSINVGFKQQANVNYIFSSQPVTNDLTGSGGTGNALSIIQIERMSGLANLGAWMMTSNASNLSARMSAIQAAIGSVEYNLAASNFTVPNALGFYNDFMARNFTGASTRVLVSSNAQGQLIGNIQGLGIGSVPEPENWALMIIGFGLIGVARRRQRPAAATIAA